MDEVSVFKYCILNISLLVSFANDIIADEVASFNNDAVYFVYF